MNGHARTFEEIFLPHLDAAYNLARWIIRNEHDAEDVVQEAYMRAFKAFAGFRGTDGRAWLLTIVRNTAFTWLKKHRREDPTTPYEEEKHSVSDVSTPRSDETVEERKEWLQKALEQLPVEFREVLVLHEMEGLPYKEIASALDIPLGTVMSRLSRARQRLQADVLKFTEGGTQP